MKTSRLMLSATLCGLLAISGCAPGVVTQGDYPSSPFSTSSTTIDERVLYVAEAGYQGVTQLIAAAVQADLLKGEKAAQVRVWNRQAYDALLAAREAQRTADARTYAEQTARVLGLIAQIQLTIRSQE